MLEAKALVVFGPNGAAGPVAAFKNGNVRRRQGLPQAVGQREAAYAGANDHNRFHRSLFYSLPRICALSTCLTRSSIFLWALSTSLSVSVRSSAWYVKA